MKFYELFKPKPGSRAEFRQKIIEELNQEIKLLKSELEQQATLLGKGSEREARLLAENAELRAKINDPARLHAHCVRHLTDAQVAHLFRERMTEIVNSRDKLEAENAALRKDKERLELERCECLRTMDLALNSNEGLRQENESLQTALDHQMGYQRELRADKDRLDWLDKTGCWLTFPGLSRHQNWRQGTARDVIDLARKEAQP